MSVFVFSADDGTDGRELWRTDGTAAGTQLVADINPGPADSNPSNLTSVGDLTFFTATVGAATELWRTDGTSAGTFALSSALNGDNPSTLTSVGGRLFYLGSDSVHGPGLFVSNGMPGGTQFVAAVTNPTDFTAVGSQLFFEATDPTHGAELWVSDGTAAGTHMVEDIDPGATGSNPTALTAFDGKVYFLDFGATDGYGLYAADPATGTVSFILDIQPFTSVSIADGYTAPPSVVLNGQLLIVGISDTDGFGLYETNGAPGNLTFLGPANGYTAGQVAYAPSQTPPSIVVSGDLAFVSADLSPPNGPDLGTELYVTDGTSAGTHLVEDIAAGRASSYPANLTAFDGGVVFTADDVVHGDQVWFSNGTAAGTYDLDINPTTDPTASLSLDPNGAAAPAAPVLFDGKAYFNASDSVDGAALWTTDGTVAGTALFSASAPLVGATSLTPVNGELFFVSGYGAPWVTNGALSGTVELSSTLSNVQGGIVLDGKLYFDAESEQSPTDYPTGLYVTDGTPGGTMEVVAGVGEGLAVVGNYLVFRDYDPVQGNGIAALDAATQTVSFLSTVFVQSNYATPALGVTSGSELYFIGGGGQAPSELWVTDGTAAGTNLVQTFGSGISDLTAYDGEIAFIAAGGGLWLSGQTPSAAAELTTMTVSSLTAVGGVLFFIGPSASSGTELWSYTAASGALSAVGDVTSGATITAPSNLLVVGDALYLTGADPDDGAQLWRVTPGGGAQVIGSPTYGPAQLIAVGDELFFTAYAGSTEGLYVVAPGATSATLLTSALGGGTPSSSMWAVGDKLYFQGQDPANGAELWVSDGTVAGTERLTDTQSPDSANASDFTVIGGEIYFSANDGVHGQELWAFDGAQGGAHLVDDINPGSGDSDPTSLTAMGGALYFIASNGAGETLWKTGGTAADTLAVTSASNGGAPQDLTVIGAELFFWGSDSVHGAGLFVSDGTAAGTTFLKAFTSADSFSDVGGVLFFEASDPVNGEELWKSDGTAAGTVQVTNTVIDPGSFPESLTSVAVNQVAGGSNQHLLLAAAGVTRFVYDSVAESPVATPDRIPNFNPGNGDTIDLSQLDAITATPALDHFTLVSSFDGHAGELIVQSADAGGMWHILGDTTGAGVANFEIAFHVVGAWDPQSVVLT